MSLTTLGAAAQHITTPMALAAAVLMLGVPLVQQVLKRRGRPNRDTKLVLRGIFILGLVFGVLATGSYLYGQSAQREIRISGAVRDEAGAGIESARVAIDGRDSGTTGPDGAFAFTIPASRSANQYVLRVFKEGYAPGVVTVSGTNPQPVSVELKRPEVSLDGVLGLPSSMSVRHYLGVPSLEVALTYTNPLPTDLHLSDIGVTLVSPAGKAIPMTMEATAVVQGRLEQPMTQWNLLPNSTFSSDYFYFNADAEFLSLQQRIFNELAPKSAGMTAPNTQASLLEPATVSDLRSYMGAHFIWTAGIWKVKAHARAKGRPLEAVATFTLEEAEVQRMRAIADYYPAALGVAPIWRFWGSADANPVLSVALE